MDIKVRANLFGAGAWLLKGECSAAHAVIFHCNSCSLFSPGRMYSDDRRYKGLKEMLWVWCSTHTQSFLCPDFKKLVIEMSTTTAPGWKESGRIYKSRAGHSVLRN